MTDVVLRDISIGVIALSLAAGAVILTGASVYDIRRARQPAIPKKRAGRRPLVSVIVYSHNQAHQTVECLNSVLRSRQRKLEVVVVNNGSTDETKQLLKEFINKHAKRAVKVINKRTSVEIEKAVASGLKAAKGEITVLLSADSILPPETIQQAADKLEADSNQAIIPATVVADRESALNLWLKFKNSLRSNWQKTASLTHPAGGGLHFGVFYSRSAIKNRKSVQNYIYDYDLILIRQPRPTLAYPKLDAHAEALPAKVMQKSAITPVLSGISWLYRLIALPVFTWYGLYLSLNRGYSYLLFLGWSVFTFVYIFSVWTDEHADRINKAKQTALAPALFSLAVIMVFVEAVASIFRLIPKTRTG